MSTRIRDRRFVETRELRTGNSGNRKLGNSGNRNLETEGPERLRDLAAAGPPRPGERWGGITDLKEKRLVRGDERKPDGGGRPVLEWRRDPLETEMRECAHPEGGVAGG